MTKTYICKLCKIELTGVHGNTKYCNSCRREVHNKWVRKHRLKPEIREKEKQYRKKYYSQLWVKERIRRYNQRPEIKVKRKQYRSTPKYKENKRKLSYTKWKNRKKRWENLSPKEQEKVALNYSKELLKHIIPEDKHERYKPRV